MNKLFLTRSKVKELLFDNLFKDTPDIILEEMVNELFDSNNYTVTIVDNDEENNDDFRV